MKSILNINIFLEAHFIIPFDKYTMSQMVPVPGIFGREEFVGPPHQII